MSYNKKAEGGWGGTLQTLIIVAVIILISIWIINKYIGTTVKEGLDPVKTRALCGFSEAKYSLTPKGCTKQTGEGAGGCLGKQSYCCDINPGDEIPPPGQTIHEKFEGCCLATEAQCKEIRGEEEET